MPESIQDKLKRIRPPRVQITYDVETGDAIIKKELPFIMGIMADLAGKPEKPLPFLKDRKFVEIDRDNFNQVMEKLEPRVAFQAPNRVDEESDSQLNVELKFRHIDDFRPAALIEQIEPLSKLYEARTRLNDLIAKLDGNDDLDGLLQDVASNTDKQQAIQQEAKSAEDDAEGSGDAKDGAKEAKAEDKGGKKDG